MTAKASATALLAAVFFAGVAGTLGVLRVLEHQEATTAEFRGRDGGRSGGPGGPRGGPSRGGSSLRPGFGGPELAPMMFTERLADRLQLTEEQRVRVEEAMDRRRKVTEEAMAEVFPRLRSQMDSLQSEIEEVLTEEQIEAFRRFQDDGGRFRRRGDRGRRSPRPD